MHKKIRHKRPRRQRVRLWMRNPNCHWCGQATELIYEHPVPQNAATIDHIFSRLHPERKLKGPTPVVLACFKCNQERGAQAQLDFHLKEKKDIRGTFLRLAAILMELGRLKAESLD